MDACEDCRHWTRARDSAGRQVGTCKRYPPDPRSRGNTAYMVETAPAWEPLYRFTRPTGDACGEWSAPGAPPVASALVPQTAAPVATSSARRPTVAHLLWLAAGAIIAAALIVAATLIGAGCDAQAAAVPREPPPALRGCQEGRDQCTDAPNAAERVCIAACAYHAQRCGALDCTPDVVIACSGQLGETTTQRCVTEVCKYQATGPDHCGDWP